MAVRRKELVYQGPIDVAGRVHEGAELRSDGSLFAVFVGQSLIDHLIAPEITWTDGLMVLSGSRESDPSAKITWRLSQPEQASIVHKNMTVKRGDGPALKKATVTLSQYRVHVEAPGIDVSFEGASIELVNGKRAIIASDGEIMMLENGGGSCCGA